MDVMNSRNVAMRYLLISDLAGFRHYLAALFGLPWGGMLKVTVSDIGAGLPLPLMLNSLWDAAS
jgi:hypothetical protein